MPLARHTTAADRENPMACEADTKDMAEIAISQGFDVKTLLTKEATRENVIDWITKAATLKLDG